MKHRCATRQRQRQQQQSPGECFRCGEQHGAPDQPFCYLQPERGDLNSDNDDDDDDGDRWKKKKPNIRYVFYDIESSQTRKIRLNSGEQVRQHDPLLLVAYVLCVKCMDAGINFGQNGQQRAEGCACGVFGRRFRYADNLLQRENRRLLAFHSFDAGHRHQSPVDKFLDFLLRSGDRYSLTITIAHNGGKYDHYMLLERLFQRGIAPRVVTTGLKYYSIDVRDGRNRRVVMKDSLNFFSCPLKDLWKTFELGAEGVQQKPWFPYLFIQRRYLNRRFHRLPPRKYYGARWMKPEERSAFLQWHAENKHGQEFCLREKLIEYCQNDVHILALACIKFRAQLRHITTKVEPFLSASTIARLTLNIFRAEFLRPHSIANLPEGGINVRGRQSHEALKFFRVLEELTGLQIRTAEYAMGEQRTPPDPRTGAQYLLDGWLQLANGQQLALEFYGCWAHGMRCKIN